ncbi:MAG: TrkH family potassium uptake protein [Treponema sp.]|jgi:trk system potassium uptake protein TrkH|nr:TrkH family potassium uptake protein [Treponema sp.]
MAVPRILVLFPGTAALAMGIPLVMAAVLGEKEMLGAFGIPMAAVIVPALLAVFLTRKQPLLPGVPDGFFFVFLAWLLTSFFGALPYRLSGAVSFCDAFFESACGFATTGATTIAGVEALPRSLLLWRSLTCWLGGMGIVLLSVALMPAPGIGGFRLLKAETPGSDKRSAAPRIRAAVKLLCSLYCGLTAVLVLLYRAGGMSWFDAVCHGLAVISSGGASTRNGGIASYHSPFIEVITVIFMLLAGINFSLYCGLFRGKWKDLLVNTECRAYLLVFVLAAGALSLSLVPVYGGDALRYGSFQAASVLSTTGYAIANYDNWPEFSRALIFCLMLTGGCSLSTAGGIKVIRHVILFKQAGNELRKLIYSGGIFSVRLNRKVGRMDIVYGTAAFVFLYFLVAAVTGLVAAASGTDVFSAFSAALAVTGNTGTGFGKAGPSGNYGAFPDHVKWLFSFVTIAGRLELWTVFILFTPEYWRR